MKKLLILAIALCMILSVFNCALAADKELTIWYNAGQNEVFLGGVEKFEEETGYTVVPNEVQWDLGSAQYAIAHASGNAPDVVMLGDWSIRGDVVNDRLYPLNNYLTETDIEATSQGFIDRFSKDGNLYGYIANTDARVMYYNKAIFREAGLDPEYFPQTWPELIEMAEKLNHVTGPNQYAYGYIGTSSGVHTSIMWETLVRSAGGFAIDPDTGKILFGSEETVAAANVYRELMEKGYSSPAVLGYDEVALQNEFCAGNIAIMMAGSWCYQPMIDAGFSADDLGYAYIPKMEGGEFATIGGAWSLCISSTCDDPDMAWKLIESIYSEDYLLFEIQGNNMVPTREKYADKVSTDFQKWLVDYFLKYGQAELHSQYFVEDIEALNLALGKAVAGEGDTQEIFDAAAKELNERHGF